MISEVAGRADELRKIRGLLFAPVSVEELLREEFPEIEEYEVIVERKGEGENRGDRKACP